MGTRAHTVPKFYLGGFVTSEANPRRDPCVWVGSAKTGEISQKSPKNISIARGWYDGPGGLTNREASIEAHLAKIENEASIAIRKFVALESSSSTAVPAAIWRFLAWQAARTPGWMELVQRWANDPDFGPDCVVVEPPPSGIEGDGKRVRSLCIEDPKTGSRLELSDLEEFDSYRRRGWRWVLRRDDYLEAMHIQAWYFQVRHFPRLSWVRLTVPEGESFVTSDRGVAWLVDGYADTPPAALRHPTAQVVAPLTKTVALVGRYGANALNVTPRDVNRFVAFAASNWIAGPTSEVVKQALSDRTAFLH